jgi:hypothetical protein
MLSHVHLIPFQHKHFGTNSKLTEYISKPGSHLIKGKYGGYLVIKLF